MPWFWRRHRRAEGCHEAKKLLAQLHAQQPEVDRMVEATEKRRAENHFREAVEAAFRGGHLDRP